MRDLMILVMIIIALILVGSVVSFILTGGSIQVNNFHYEFKGIIEILIKLLQ